MVALIKLFSPENFKRYWHKKEIFVNFKMWTGCTASPFSSNLKWRFSIENYRIQLLVSWIFLIFFFLMYVFIVPLFNVNIEQSWVVGLVLYEMTWLASKHLLIPVVWAVLLLNFLSRSGTTCQLMFELYKSNNSCLVWIYVCIPSPGREVLYCCKLNMRMICKFWWSTWQVIVKISSIYMYHCF